MVGELLVWIGVALAALAAWSLYATTSTGPIPRDQERRDPPEDE